MVVGLSVRAVAVVEVLMGIVEDVGAVVVVIAASIVVVREVMAAGVV